MTIATQPEPDEEGQPAEEEAATEEEPSEDEVKGD